MNRSIAWTIVGLLVFSVAGCNDAPEKAENKSGGVSRGRKGRGAPPPVQDAAPAPAAAQAAVPPAAADAAAPAAGKAEDEKAEKTKARKRRNKKDSDEEPAPADVAATPPAAPGQPAGPGQPAPAQVAPGQPAVPAQTAAIGQPAVGTPHAANPPPAAAPSLGGISLFGGSENETGLGAQLGQLRRNGTPVQTPPPVVNAPAANNPANGTATITLLPTPGGAVPPGIAGAGQVPPGSTVPTIAFGPPAKVSTPSEALASFSFQLLGRIQMRMAQQNGPSALPTAIGKPAQAPQAPAINGNAGIGTFGKSVGKINMIGAGDDKDDAKSKQQSKKKRKRD